MRILAFLFILGLFLDFGFAEEPVENISWDKDKNILSYSISKDSTVKIRVGSSSGPVYRTLVNLEERKAGRNQESWDAKDESGLIEFSKYEPLHFCIDARPGKKKDLILNVDSSLIDIQKAIVKAGPKPVSISLNIDKKEQDWFGKEEMEVMVFVDNRLIRLARAKTLPYTIKLDLKDYLSGEHLLTFNAWSGDHTAVAYRNLKISPQTQKDALLTGKIAYCQRYKGFWQIEIADLDGSKPFQLTSSPIDKRYPSFSPDGKRIAYVTNNGELWVVNIDASDNRKIPLSLHCSQPRWLSNGKEIAFVSYQDLYHGDSKIWQVDLETFKLKKIINRPWLQYDPCYSSDESSLIFTDGPELYGQEIYRLNLENGGITQLTDNGAYVYDMQPVYSSDGSLIAYSSLESGNYDIWIMDKDTQNRTNLSKNSSYDIMPRITKDKKQIYFISDRSGSLQVWRMDINGNNPIQITKTKTDKQDLALYTNEN